MTLEEQVTLSRQAGKALYFGIEPLGPKSKLFGERIREEERNNLERGKRISFRVQRFIQKYS